MNAYGLPDNAKRVAADVDAFLARESVLNPDVPKDFSSDNKQESAFLYSMWNGCLIVYKGKVIPSMKKGWSLFIHAKKHNQCSAEEGVIYNAVVWLYERDDNEAREILIDYEFCQIRNQEIKILGHKQKIEMLKTSPIIDCQFI